MRFATLTTSYGVVSWGGAADPAMPSYQGTESNTFQLIMLIGSGLPAWKWAIPARTVCKICGLQDSIPLSHSDRHVFFMNINDMAMWHGYRFGCPMSCHGLARMNPTTPSFVDTCIEPPRAELPVPIQARHVGLGHPVRPRMSMPSRLACCSARFPACAASPTATRWLRDERLGRRKQG